MKQIETKRLILRQFRGLDLDELHEFLRQLKDDEFEGYSDITCENAKDHLRQRIDSDEFYAMELKETGKVIGNICCGIRDQDAREMGFIVNKDFQGKGYGLEALSAVMEHLFETGKHRVYAECDPRNEASWRLLEKAGMRRETHLKKNVFFHRDENGDPIWKDTYVYALLDEEAGK